MLVWKSGVRGVLVRSVVIAFRDSDIALNPAKTATPFRLADQVTIGRDNTTRGFFVPWSLEESVMDNVYSDLGGDYSDFPDTDVEERSVVVEVDLEDLVRVIVRGEEIVGLMHGAFGDCGDDADCPACNWRVEALQTVMELSGAETLAALDVYRACGRQFEEEVA